MSYDHPLGDTLSVSCRACGAAVGARCGTPRGATAPLPHSARKADFRASVRDLGQDLARLDARQQQALRAAASGLRMNGTWWGNQDGKRVSVSHAVASELERWGALERTRGRELSLSPYGEQLLAGLEGSCS